jgi:hypothetical protein
MIHVICINTFQSKMNVLILFPNNACAQNVSVRLLESGHHVTLYCPNQNDVEKAGKLTEELAIIALEQNRFRGVEERFSTLRGDDFESFDILGNTTLYFYNVLMVLGIPERSELYFHVWSRDLFISSFIRKITLGD